MRDSDLLRKSMTQPAVKKIGEDLRAATGALARGNASVAPGGDGETRRVVLSINTSWNIANFRAGLIAGLRAAGYEVVAVAPPIPTARDWKRWAAGSCRSPWTTRAPIPSAIWRLLGRYLHLLRRERPHAFLGYTIKPNVYGSLAAHMLGIPVINNVSGLGTAFIRNSWLTPVVKGLYRTALRKSHTVFFQNEDDRGLFVDLGLVPRPQTDVLPGSGINLQAFAPVPTSSGEPTAHSVSAHCAASLGQRDPGVCRGRAAGARDRSRGALRPSRVSGCGEPHGCVPR